MRRFRVLVRYIPLLSLLTLLTISCGGSGGGGGSSDIYGNGYTFKWGK